MFVVVIREGEKRKIVVRARPRPLLGGIGCFGMGNEWGMLMAFRLIIGVEARGTMRVIEVRV
jgi:hypothetical protein